MYLEYFGLRENPFSLSPDPRFLFYSSNHKEALAQMIYAAKEDSGFMVLTGEVGTGKTVLINTLIKQFPKSYHFAKIYHSALSPQGLIQNICKEFRLDFKNKNMTQLILNIQDFLKWNYKSGGKSILIIDEAQNLGLDTLEEIRLLSNFEDNDKKILQIFLIGQPEFEIKLQYEHIRQLRERVSLKYKLQRLNRNETQSYIRHRLAVAGFTNKQQLFSEQAIDELYDVSQGVPRRINILCDNALISTYSHLFKKINSDIIKEAVHNSQMQRYKESRVMQRGVTQSTTQTPVAVRTATAVNTALPNNVHVVSKQSRLHTTVGSNGRNGAVDYKKIEKILYQLVKNHGMFSVRKPRLSTILFSLLLAFIMVVLAFYLAIILAVESGIIQ